MALSRMDHRDVLERLCRICGRIAITKTMKTKYNCGEFLLELARAFGVSTEADDPNVHPEHFCHACKLILAKSTKSNSHKHHAHTFAGWCAHSEDNCEVCEHFAGLQRGGRPKKGKRTPGRPSQDTVWTTSV